MSSKDKSYLKTTMLLLLTIILMFITNVIPGLSKTFIRYDIRGVPLKPGETIWGTGHFVGDVNIYSGFGRVEIPLNTLIGRGNVAFPLTLYNSTEVKDIVTVDNTVRQASWVGMGWGLDAPYIFGNLDVTASGRDPDIFISDIDTDYFLFWNGIADPIKASGTWELKYRKYWKLEKTLDELDYVESFTFTDLNGTKYTFDHRRETCITLFDSEEQKADQENDIPYRWDLTKIEDVTQNNSISIVYDDVTGTCYGQSYTQASYLDTITCNASGRYFAFVLQNRSDYPSSPDDPAEIYEKKRIDWILFKNTSGDTLWRYNFNHTYYGSGASQKLLLDHVQQWKKTDSDSLPSWKFHVRTSGESNSGALETLTTPQGGTKTYTYASHAGNYRVSSVAIDRQMGVGSETTNFSAAGTSATVTPPGSFGYIKYYLNSVAYGLNAGTLNRTEIYNDSDELVGKTYHTLADSTTIYRDYQLIRDVTFIPFEEEPADSLSVKKWVWFSSSNGLPSSIREEVSPFEPRGFTIDTTPSNKHWFHRSRVITYASSIYSGMNASNSHQLAEVYQEVIREEVKDNGTTWKTAPISASKATWTQPGGEDYYRLDKFYIWTGADAAGDTSISWGASETDTFREIVDSDNYGNILEEKDGEGRITRYYYGDNSSNLDNTATGFQHRYLTGVKQYSGSDSLTTKTDWNGDMGLVTEVEDANGSKTKSEYDDYYRPVRTKNHNDVTLLEITYSFARDQSGDGSFDSTKPNYVRTKSQYIYAADNDTTNTYNTIFTDGWGRTLQTHQRNDSNDIIRAFGYYIDGALSATYSPYDTSNSNHSYENPRVFGDCDSSYYEYESDPRRRLKKITFPTMDTSTRPYSTVSYTLQTITSGPAKNHMFVIVTSTDENSVTHENWIGSSGGVLKTTVGGSYAAEAWKNVLGAPALILPPRTSGSRTSALRTDITNSPFGREIERDEPDQNTTKIVYDRNLVPIYVQEAADAGGNDFWATTFDSYGRISRIGLEKDQSSSWYTRIPTTPTSSHGSEEDEWRKKYDYDYDYFGASPTITDSSRGRLTRVQGEHEQQS